MNRRLPLLLLAVAALSSCANQEIPLSIRDLDEARALAAEERWNEVDSLLRDFQVRDFDLATQRDFNLLAGRAADEEGDWSRAIRYYEAFVLQAGPADEALVVERRLLDLGLDLLRGELRVFWIFTDRSRGVMVLENLAYSGRFAETRALALAELGAYRWDDERWSEAAPYYAGLLAPELAGQGWDDLAAFRLAMSARRMLEDDRTYYSGILEALDQLQAYLDAYPSGLHRIEAETAHAEARELLALHHLQVGDYYARIGNPVGAQYHWAMAAGEAPDGSNVTAALVRGTDSARTASERLAEGKASS